MKFIITESKLDKVVSMYLDNQDFVVIKKRNYIFFVNSEGDEYAQIEFNKKDGWCFINFKLIKEISNFFSLGRFDSEKVIGGWIENTLQMKVANATMLNDEQMNIYK